MRQYSGTSSGDGVVILFLQSGNNTVRAGVSEGSGIRWVSCEGKDLIPCVDSAIAFLSGVDLSGIVVLESLERVSWSAIRGLVTVANTMAFAHGIPAILMDAVTDDGELIASAKSLLRGTASSHRITPYYDGEPNITTPRQ